MAQQMEKQSQIARRRREILNPKLKILRKMKMKLYKQTQSHFAETSFGGNQNDVTYSKPYTNLILMILVIGKNKANSPTSGGKL